MKNTVTINIPTIERDFMSGWDVAVTRTFYLTPDVAEEISRSIYTQLPIVRMAILDARKEKITRLEAELDNLKNS